MADDVVREAAQLRAVIARMATEPDFARSVRDDPARLTREFDLSADDAATVLRLTDETPDGHLPEALAQRLSKSSIGASGLSSLFHFMNGVPAEPPAGAETTAPHDAPAPDFHVLEPQQHTSVEADAITHNADGTTTVETVLADGTRVDVVEDSSGHVVSQTEYGPGGAQSGQVVYGSTGQVVSGSGVVHATDPTGPVTMTFNSDGTYTTHDQYGTDTVHSATGATTSSTTSGTITVIGSRSVTGTQVVGYGPDGFADSSTVTWDDSAGHHVLVHTGEQSGGITTETITAPDGTTTVDTWNTPPGDNNTAHAVVVQATVTAPDGTTTTTHFDSAGHPISGAGLGDAVTHNSDGTTTIETVLPDGTRVDVVQDSSGQVMSQTEYGPDGTQTGQVVYHSGGVSGSGVVHTTDTTGAITMTFHSDGTYTTHDQYGTDTTYNSDGTHAGGVATGTFTVLGSRSVTGTQQIGYDPAGFPDSSTVTWDDASGHHVLVHLGEQSGGITTETITATDGTTTVDTWNTPPGDDNTGHAVIVQTTVTSPDGTSATTHFDSAGHPVSGTGLADAVTHNADGTTTVETVLPDGTRVDVVTDSSGHVVSQTEYGPDGTQTGQLLYGSGGVTGSGVVHSTDPTGPVTMTFNSDGTYTTHDQYGTDTVHSATGATTSSTTSGTITVIGSRSVTGTQVVGYGPDGFADSSTVTWDDAAGHHVLVHTGESSGGVTTETITAPDGTTTVDTWNTPPGDDNPTHAVVVQATVTATDGSSTTTNYDLAGHPTSTETTPPGGATTPPDGATPPPGGATTPPTGTTTDPAPGMTTDPTGTTTTDPTTTTTDPTTTTTDPTTPTTDPTTTTTDPTTTTTDPTTDHSTIAVNPKLAGLGVHAPTASLTPTADPSATPASAEPQPDGSQPAGVVVEAHPGTDVPPPDGTSNPLLAETSPVTHISASATSMLGNASDPPADPADDSSTGVHVPTTISSPAPAPKP